MSCAQSVWFLLVLVLLNFVQTKEYCDFDNAKCLTHAARNVFKIAVAGIDGVIDPIDPLYTNDIKGEVPYTKYLLTNPKMTGLKNCHVVKLEFQPNEAYEYELYCPQLVVQYGHEVKGDFGPLKLDGKGQVKLTYTDYTIILKGKTESFVSEVDDKLRILAKNFLLDTDLNGNLTVEVDNLVNGDKEKSAQAEAYLNQHPKLVEKHVRAGVIVEFIKLFIERVNIILTTYPFEEIAPKI